MGGECTWGEWRRVATPAGRGWYAFMMVVGGGIFALRKMDPAHTVGIGEEVGPIKNGVVCCAVIPPFTIPVDERAGWEGKWAGNFRPAPTDSRASAGMALRAVAPTILSFPQGSLCPAGDPSGYPPLVGSHATRHEIGEWGG